LGEDNAGHILVVDDDEIITRVVSGFLSLSGFQVTTSHDGDDGLRKIKELEPDLVILDMMMPGKTGLDVMEEMQGDPRMKDIPVLFLTGVDDEATVAKCLRGAEDYMVKPLKRLELEARVRNILDRKSKEGAKASGPLDRLAVRAGDETYLVPLAQVFYVAASGKYSIICTRNRELLSDYSIGRMEEMLGETGDFLRIHRSFIVNVNYVLKVTRETPKKVILVMADEKHSRLNVSNSYLPKVKARLGL